MWRAPCAASCIRPGRTRGAVRRAARRYTRGSRGIEPCLRRDRAADALLDARHDFLSEQGHRALDERGIERAEVVHRGDVPDAHFMKLTHLFGNVLDRAEQVDAVG